MGLRWQYSEDNDIKLSGKLAHAAMVLGFLTKSKEYDNCFSDVIVVLDKEKVGKICYLMGEWRHNDHLSELDEFKLDELDDWWQNSDETTITFV